MNKEDLKEAACFIVSVIVALVIVFAIVEVKRSSLERMTGKRVSWWQTFFIKEI